ncbi:hypothetical protein PanWU01x14_256160 [Parasponia andersonii]|uniref:Uncharacterized protein n=1 Tax=Parasponia andersonii TaxID=3476 RepID=A0A2P5BAM0_PARAD|nr:hypothetical protein PanWU01x14_256160 [Parasponia andersonii]
MEMVSFKSNLQNLANCMFILVGELLGVAYCSNWKEFSTSSCEAPGRIKMAFSVLRVRLARNF